MRMERTDEALARSAVAGDGPAFEMLLLRHYDRLFSLCFRLMGAADRAEDLTQDICAALPAKLRGYRAEARFSTWLYRVAVNAAHDKRRKLATARKAAEGWGDWETNRRAEIAEAQDAQVWLQRAMSALPESIRDTLALTLAEDMTQAQAAAVLDISEGTVAWRISEAKRLLREMKELER